VAKEKAAKPAKVSKAKGAKVAPEVDLEDLKQKLVAQAKKDGKVDQKVIFKLFPETLENAEVLDSLYTELADLNVEITVPGPDVGKVCD